MQRERRLRKSSDFAAARRHGRSWADPLLVLIARRNGADVSRVGFAVGRRVGNAVVRNRIKRRLRTLTRPVDIADGWDLVFIARRDAAISSFPELARAVSRLLRRSRVASS
jgi:ribonuclease P protein component